MEWFLLVVSLLIVAWLLWRGLRSSAASVAPRLEPSFEDQSRAFRFCPLCGSALQKGETVYSIMYSKDRDTLMDIHGCPYCRPDSSRRDPSRVRRCPVCRRELEEGETIPARVFRRSLKMLIHILGCKRCRPFNR